MIKCLAAAACLAALSSPAIAASKVEARIYATVGEWTIAHCDASQIPPMATLMIMTIIGGSSREELNPYRRFVRRLSETRFASEELACEHYIGSLQLSME